MRRLGVTLNVTEGEGGGELCSSLDAGREAPVLGHRTALHFSAACLMLSFVHTPTLVFIASDKRASKGLAGGNEWERRTVARVDRSSAIHCVSNAPRRVGV